MTQLQAPARPPTVIRMRRARCVTTAFLLLVTWPVAIVLFVLWIVSVVLSLFTVLMPLMVACTAMTRRYAEAHRRWAVRVLGAGTPAFPAPDPGAPPDGYPTRPLPPVTSSSPPATPSSLPPVTSSSPPRGTSSSPQRTSSSPPLFSRAVAILRDPMSWRRWGWLLVHAVVTPVLACLPLALLGSTLLYLAYPLLFAITPEQVFGNPFGLFELHSMGEAAFMMPLAVVTFGLWFAIAPSLVRAQAAVTSGLLGRRDATVPA